MGTRFTLWKHWEEAIDHLALSPLGVLHDDVNRLLREELPSSIHLRPILEFKKLIAKGLPKVTLLNGKKLIFVLFVPAANFNLKDLEANEFVVDLNAMGMV